MSSKLTDLIDQVHKNMLEKGDLYYFSDTLLNYLKIEVSSMFGKGLCGSDIDRVNNILDIAYDKLNTDYSKIERNI